ncbi:MAG: MBL fold metallo-hydrolase [Bacteroidota bacterium]
MRKKGTKKINRKDGKSQRKLFVVSIILLAIIFNSCTAILSTSNSVGSSISTLLSSPKVIENKITNPIRDDARLAVLWVGHATLLIQIDDKFILTDPVFTETTAFISKRLVEPGIEPKNLPDIDVVLISHLHADHLSLGSLDMIEPKTKELLVPQEGLVYIPNYDFNSSEIKLWQSWEKDGLKITSVPVLHNGMRYGIDAAWLDKSYTGYIIQYNEITVYFGGDTGYKPETQIFKDTRNRFPNIDLAFLPIAPIHPREYSGGRHTDPADAIKIMTDLNAKKMIPIHYDTFAEAYDSTGEAVNTMRSEIRKNNFTEDGIIILEIGEQKVIVPQK